MSVPFDPSVTNPLKTKTIQLCSHDLKPSNIGSHYNDEQLKDVIAKAVKKGEIDYYNDYNDYNAPNATERTPVGSKTPVIGSSDWVTNPFHDAGLLSTVFDAYNYHYNLRTGPEDWWYTIIQKVAMAIDENSKNDQVRKFFVQHEGKKQIRVKVGATFCIECIDYDWLFDQFSHGIEKNINVPEYVADMKSDFSTSTSVHKIVAQIALMHSVQEYFEYVAYTHCGIPAIEMKGTQQDWEKLVEKVKKLRNTLEPIHNAIGLTYWWDNVENITNKLLDTYNGEPDEDWWSRIINRESYGSGAPDFYGWFMVNLLNIHDASSLGDAPSGLVSIPIKLEGEKGDEDSAVVAGMAGYKIHINGRNGVPALEPVHGWSLFLEPNSAYRPHNDSDWQEQVNGVENILSGAGSSIGKAMVLELLQIFMVGLWLTF